MSTLTLDSLSHPGSPVDMILRKDTHYIRYIKRQCSEITEYSVIQIQEIILSTFLLIKKKKNPSIVITLPSTKDVVMR